MMWVHGRPQGGAVAPPWKIKKKVLPDLKKKKV